MCRRPARRSTPAAQRTNRFGVPCASRVPPQSWRDEGMEAHSRSIPDSHPRKPAISPGGFRQPASAWRILFPWQSLFAESCPESGRATSALPVAFELPPRPIRPLHPEAAPESPPSSQHSRIPSRVSRRHHLSGGVDSGAPVAAQAIRSVVLSKDCRYPRSVTISASRAWRPSAAW